MLIKPLDYLEVSALCAQLAFLEYDCYAMAWGRVQLRIWGEACAIS